MYKTELGNQRGDMWLTLDNFSCCKQRVYDTDFSSFQINWRKWNWLCIFWTKTMVLTQPGPTNSRRLEQGYSVPFEIIASRNLFASQSASCPFPFCFYLFLVFLYLFFSHSFFPASTFSCLRFPGEDLESNSGWVDMSEASTTAPSGMPTCHSLGTVKSFSLNHLKMQKHLTLKDVKLKFPKLLYGILFWRGRVLKTSKEQEVKGWK